MLNILCVQGSYLPAIDGVSLRAKRLFTPLVETKRCQMHILVPQRSFSGTEIYKDPVPEYEVIEGIHVHRVGKFRDLPLKIRSICRDWNVDVIHVRSPRFVLYSLVEIVNRPIVLEIGGLLQSNALKDQLIRCMYNLSTRLIVHSHSAKNFLTRKYDVPAHKVKVIINGIHLNRFTQGDINKTENIKRRHRLEGSLTVGYLGRFRKWQGVQYLVRAIPEIIPENRNVKFLLVGAGPAFNYIRTLVEQLDLQNWVVLPGEIPPTEVPSYISCMDIFVVPRPSVLQTETAIPHKVLEAMAMGRAIVGTKVAGLLEVLEHEETGILTEPQDVHELADAIKHLLQDETLRRRLGTNARLALEMNSQYSWDKAAENLFSLYKEVTDI